MIGRINLDPKLMRSTNYQMDERVSYERVDSDGYGTNGLRWHCLSDVCREHFSADSVRIDYAAGWIYGP